MEKNSLCRQSRIIHYLERMVMHMLRHLIWQSVIYNIQFGEVQIPGQHNVKTDVLSKKTFTLGHVSGAPVTRF